MTRLIWGTFLLLLMSFCDFFEGFSFACYIAFYSILFLFSLFSLIRLLFNRPSLSLSFNTPINALFR